MLSNFFKIWYVKRYDDYCSCHVVTFSKKSTWRARESKVYKKCVSLTALFSMFGTHFGNNFGKLWLWKVWSNKKKAWKCIWSTLRESSPCTRTELLISCSILWKKCSSKFDMILKVVKTTLLCMVFDVISFWAFYEIKTKRTPFSRAAPKI